MAGEIRRFVDKDGVAHQVDYEYLANKPTIPTRTSQLTNDSQFITTAQLADITSRIDDLVSDLRAAGIYVSDGDAAGIVGTKLYLTGATVDGTKLTVNSGSVSNGKLSV